MRILHVVLFWVMALGGLSSCALFRGDPVHVQYDRGVTESGVRWEDTRTGQGHRVSWEDTVTVHMLTQLPDGTRVDSTRERGVPLTFSLQNPPVPGLLEGITGMRPGGQRSMLLPPSRAFGSEGIPGRVPPESPVRFAVELLSATR